MSIDKVQPDTLIEQAALSQLREQAPVDGARLNDASVQQDTVTDDAARQADAAGLTDAVTTETRASRSLDSGDQLIASDAWQGTPAHARSLMDGASLSDQGDLAQSLDEAVAFVLNPLA